MLQLISPDDVIIQEDDFDLQHRCDLELNSCYIALGQLEILVGSYRLEVTMSDKLLHFYEMFTRLLSFTGKSIRSAQKTNTFVKGAKIISFFKTSF